MRRSGVRLPKAAPDLNCGNADVWIVRLDPVGDILGDGWQVRRQQDPAHSLGSTLRRWGEDVGVATGRADVGVTQHLLHNGQGHRGQGDSRSRVPHGVGSGVLQTGLTQYLTPLRPVVARINRAAVWLAEHEVMVVAAASDS